LPGNTDALLTIGETNRNDAFKDWIRTEEMEARKRSYGRAERMVEDPHLSAMLERRTFAAFDGQQDSERLS